jgi:hypothetical protein
MAATFKTPQYFSNNGHYYQAVVSSESWNSAVTTANNKTYLGLTGYLATITSKAENDFVAGVVGGNTWEYSYIGGSDSNTEGNFSWMTGQ